MTRRHLRLVVTLVVAAVLQAAPVGAQWVCDDASNLTVNCGFDYSIGGWTLWAGDSFAYSADGHHASGSIEIGSQSTMGYAASIEQCVGGLGGLSAVDGGFWVRLVGGPLDSCSLNITQYTGTGCSGGYLGYAYVGRYSFTTEWEWVGATFPLDATAASLMIEASCYAFSADFTVRFDDIYLGKDLQPPLFADGFELGNMSRWSQSVP